jgi:hypothetical protein
MEETLRMAQVGCGALGEVRSGPTPGRAPFISSRIFCAGAAAKTGGPRAVALSDFPGRIVGPPGLRRNRR